MDDQYAFEWGQVVGTPYPPFYIGLVTLLLKMARSGPTWV